MNKNFDESEKAIDDINSVLALAFEGEYWQLKEPAQKQKEILDNILLRLKDNPPDKFTDEHKTIQLLFKTIKEYNNIMINFSEDGNKEAFINIDAVTNSLNKYLDSSVFLKEYRIDGYKSQFDYEAAFKQIEENSRMNKVDYTKNIKESYEQFIVFVNAMMEIMKTYAIAPNDQTLLDTAENTAKGLKLLQNKMNVVKPPVEYEIKNGDFAKLVELYVSASELLEKAMRMPDDVSIEKMNEYLLESNKYLESTYSLVNELTGAKLQIPSTTPTITEETNELDEAKWKTYKNQRFGFLIGYPKDWTKGEEPTDGGGITISDGNGSSINAAGGFYFEDLPPNLTDYEKVNTGKTGFTTYQNTTIDGNNAIVTKQIHIRDDKRIEFETIITIANGEDINLAFDILKTFEIYIGDEG